VIDASGDKPGFSAILFHDAANPESEASAKLEENSLHQFFTCL
jgi:hypothetical protein